jgi:hypothetical protein
MSLAMYASPIESDTTNNDISSTYAKRRGANNRTQKRQDYNESKVNSVLNAIHNKTPSSDSSLGDFKPIEPPISVGVENTKINNPDSNSEDDLDLRDLNTAHMTEQVSEEYYKQFIPTYRSQQQQQQLPPPPPQPATQAHGYNGPNSNIITKLNYMIHLLEEQKDERTNNVTEEVVLYSFLGIFVIFIVDSFVRVGKYVR